MGEEGKGKKIFWDLNFEKLMNSDRIEERVTDVHGDDVYDSISEEYSMEEEEDSSNSIISSSSTSTELLEDASSYSSPSSSSSSSNTNGPLSDLSELMNQLPIKRGLSKFYDGKSQSYTSLASVRSLEDLAKKVNSTTFRSKMKSCKSYAGVLDGSNNNKSYNNNYSPKATILKKTSHSRGSFLSKRASLVGDC